MSTRSKGNRLEDDLYAYLSDQKSRGLLVYGAHPAPLCKIYKKKKYYCKEREANVEFDVVIEVFREGRDKPHLYIVFECKNHGSAVAERDVTDFSDKIGRLFRHAAKGVMVVSSSLQAGAEKLTQNRGMGIVKFDQNGLEVTADRTSRLSLEREFFHEQFFPTQRYVKSLKFTAFWDGKFLGSMDALLSHIDPNTQADHASQEFAPSNVPYKSVEEIREISAELLQMSGHKGGAVDLATICSILSVTLDYTDREIEDQDGNSILGSANFERRSIQINRHQNKHRERFTIGHELGHFYMNHSRYLYSESIIKRDLFSEMRSDRDSFINRLEHQANLFASELLLPEPDFCHELITTRQSLGIVNKGHGFIFVDDQPCNYQPYNHLLLELSSLFDVSRRAIEVKLKRMGILADQRKEIRAFRF